MDRLCERPGCSDRASVAYGMRPENLVFWLDALSENNADGGRLCLRHADSMVVPRGWTLDDLRESELHLFRPPAVEPKTRQGRRVSSGDDSMGAEQLELGVEPAGAGAAVTETLPADPEADADAAVAAQDAADQDDDPQVWAPSFDQADDLDGLLSARSPLLARAFRGNDRPRS